VIVFRGACELGCERIVSDNLVSTWVKAGIHPLREPYNNENPSASLLEPHLFAAVHESCGYADTLNRCPLSGVKRTSALLPHLPYLTVRFTVRGGASPSGYGQYETRAFTMTTVRKLVGIQTLKQGSVPK
jgi:hypothetical protein